MAPFVILEHTCLDSCHWDLMLRDGEILATWQVNKPLRDWGETALDCQKIADHRLVYLDFEGHLTLNRGKVKQVAVGKYDLKQKKPGFWQVFLQADTIKGILELKKSDKNQWKLVFLGER